jgi:hypothetical protein
VFYTSKEVGASGDESLKMSEIWWDQEEFLPKPGDLIIGSDGYLAQIHEVVGDTVGIYRLGVSFKGPTGPTGPTGSAGS